MPDIIEVKAKIKGEVQGVFFRSETMRAAHHMGVTGYVKNLSDGSVEAVFQGDDDRVSKTVQWCRQGPAMSRVKDVTVEKRDHLSPFKQFQIRY